MDIQGTPAQVSFGFALASFFLCQQIVGEAVKRGEMSTADASALFGAARSNLESSRHLLGGDPAVMQIAIQSLLLIEQTTAALSAETPHEGPN